MKARFLTLFLLCGLSIPVSVATWLTAQSDSDSVGTHKTKNLQEVMVKASHTIQKGDRTKIFITREMRRDTRSIGELLGNEPNFYFDKAFNTLTYNNSSKRPPGQQPRAASAVLVRWRQERAPVLKGNVR